MGKDHELLEAARTGNLLLVEKLIFSKSKSSSFAASLGIRVGAHVNCQDQNGYTPLHHASLNGHSAIVHVLLEAGASVNVPDYKGSCPLHLAAWNGKAEIVKFLLTIGPNFASVNEQNGDKETALHCAAQHGHTDSAQILLDNHADAQIRNIRDESALDLASQYGRLEVVRMLLTYYPKLLAHSPERFTPLHLASRNGHRGVVELLLVHGADINKVGANGTALHEAALFGKYDVVSLLLKRGAETGSKDSSGRTALELVSQLDTQISREIAKLIIERMQDGDDYEPLRSIITSTPQKKDMKAKNQFDQPTNVFASGAKVSRHLSRSFGEADLPSRDSSRGRPSITTPFRYSRHSQLSPDVSKSPSSHRIKHSFLRRSSSARSARSLPRLVSSASFHGNRSLHSFSAHRKKSHDAISIQDWSIRQHHPSIDMFPVTPTRPSQTSRRTSASEPSSPQLGASFVSSIHHTDSPELEFRSTPFGLDDDTVFLPGTPTSARPSFETFLPQTPKHEPKAVIPLKPPADKNTSSPQKSSTNVSIIIKQPTIEDELSPSETELSAISHIKSPPPLPKKSTSSPPCGVEPQSPPIDPGIYPFSSSTLKDNEGSISKTREDTVELLSPSKSFEGHHESSAHNTSLSSTSDLSPTVKSPGAPRKPQRHKPVLTPPPLPPKPAHMLQEPKKPRPPSPTNPPPIDDEISDEEPDVDGGEKQEEKHNKSMGQSSPPTVCEAYHKNKEPTSKLSTTRTTETISPVPSSSPRSSSSTITNVPSPTDTITSGISEKTTLSQNDAAENKLDAREPEAGPKQALVTKIPLQVGPDVSSTSKAFAKQSMRSDISVSQEDTKTPSEAQIENEVFIPSKTASKVFLAVGSSGASTFQPSSAKSSIHQLPVSQEGAKFPSESKRENKISIPGKTASKVHPDSAERVLGASAMSNIGPAVTSTPQAVITLLQEGARTPSEGPTVKVFIPSSGGTSTLQAPSAKQPSIRFEKSVSQEDTKTQSNAQGQKETKVSIPSKTASEGGSSGAQTSKSPDNSSIHTKKSMSQEGAKTQSEVQGNKVFIPSKNILESGSTASSKTRTVTRAGSNAPSSSLETKVVPKGQGIKQIGHPGQTRGDAAAPHTTTKISPPEPQNPSVICTTHLFGTTSEKGAYSDLPAGNASHSGIEHSESTPVSVTKTPGGTKEHSALKNLPRDPSPVRQAPKNEKPTKLSYSTKKGHVVGADVTRVTALPNLPHSGKSANSVPTIVTKPDGGTEPLQIPSNKEKTPIAPSSTIQVLIHASEDSTRGKQVPDTSENPLSPTLRSPSPPFSPPSPNTAMLQVSSALQKAMPPPMRSSFTNPPMHSSIQTKPQPPPSGSNWTPKPYTKALIEQNRQKPEIPKKKPSIRQHLKTRDTQNAKIIAQPASPTFRLSQNLGVIEKNTAKQPPLKKPPSPNINSNPVPGSKVSSKTRKLGHNVDMNKIIAPKPFARMPPPQKPQSPTAGHEQKRPAKLNTSKQASKSPPQSHESKTLLRPQSGLHYTATEVKRARICSTRSVTEISASQTYGEYDNVSGAIEQLSRSKRSSSLGPQVATPFPVKPMQVEIEVQTMEPVRKVSDAFTQTYPPKVPHRRRSLQKSKSVDRVHHEPKLTNSPTIKPLGVQNPVQQQPESFAKRPDSSPRPVPRIKPPLVTTPPMSAQTRRLQRPKKPAKPAYLSLNSKAAPSKKTSNPNERIQSPAKTFSKERIHSPHSTLEKSSLADKSVISVLSLDTSDDWNDALSDRTEELNIPKEVRKYRGNNSLISNAESSNF